MKFIKRGTTVAHSLSNATTATPLKEWFRCSEADMKALTVAEKRKNKQKHKVYLDEQARTKAALFKTTQSAAEKFPPQNLLPDITDDVHLRRKSANLIFLKLQGQFSNHVANLALNDSDWETKEVVAAWLREEMRSLREAEATSVGAPVRRGKALSRTHVADIAVELIECVVGQQLACLFQELLEIDRHRKALADDFTNLNEGAWIEAHALFQTKPIGVRELAKLISVAPSTVTRWRESSTFNERVERHQRVLKTFLRDQYFDELRKEYPKLAENELFRRAYRKHIETMAEGNREDLEALRGFQASKSTEVATGVALVLPTNANKSTPKKTRKNFRLKQTS